MSEASRKPLVVAVDDDADFLEAIRHMLQPAYRVECLSDGADLSGRLEGLDPDLLLLDMHMPGVDGVGACRDVRKAPGLSDLPILFLTASKDDEDFLRGIQVGADAYLTKPIATAELRRRVREALARQ